MPKEITDIKKFLSMAKGEGAKVAKTDKAGKPKTGKEAEHKAHPAAKKVLWIKHTKKITKFKLRTPGYLYTFKTGEKEKAKILLQSIPQNLQRIEIKSKKLMAKKKKK
eukprot:CAMPEP_0176433794 /NCGR_PEP_ID=MMETSP0127-20121128/16254_1 /TAXON_ID=938130 /ORGANISM="Platyophrya macrostoma, Strain WH" /LENGTH=107 /DNA_ID=CAMNT_0017816329 /DNA_START=51 /DNA_END=374 /DNA_ORIENTATION=-